VTELAAHFLDAAAARTASPGAASAIDMLEWLTSSIAADRDAGLFAAWGRSTAIDENVGTAVLPEPAFRHLHELAGADSAWPIANAGVLHCYGYLLSRTRTPYGLKRERWLGSDLSRAYGLPDDAFVPWTGGPTLLERATEAATALLRSPAAAGEADVDGRAARVALTAASGPAALAYAVASAAGDEPLLVTTFPVADAAAVLEEFAADQRLRWNAV